MSPFRFAKCAALAAAVFCSLTAAAQAQDVLAVDVQRVVSESTVGQYIESQLNQIAQTIQGEIGATATALETEMQQLQTEASALTPEALQANTDLLQRNDALQTRITAFQQQQAQADADMQATQQQALSPVLTALETILQSIRAEREATVIINAASAVAIDPEADVTATAIERLNAQMTSTPVTRVSVSAQQQQAAPAQ